jgi:hypothetical protein
MRKEQVVKRSVREHDAKITIPRGHLRSDDIARPFGDYDDRALRRVKKSALFFPHQTIAFNLLHSIRH